MKFEFINTNNRYKLYPNDDDKLMSIVNGAIELFKYRKSSQSQVTRQDESIQYGSEMNSLIGESNGNPIQFTPKRIVVYQMENPFEISDEKDNGQRLTNDNIPACRNIGNGESGDLGNEVVNDERDDSNQSNFQR